MSEEITLDKYDRDFLNWFAGFFEGEGSIGIYRNNGKNQRFYGKIAVYQANKKPLCLIQNVFGGGITKHNGGKGRLGKKVIYCWYLTKRIKLIEIIEAILPFLRFRKEQVQLILRRLREFDAKSQCRSWSKSEITFLRQNYGKIPVRMMVQSNLYRHPESGILQKAKKLGLNDNFGKDLRIRDAKGRLRRKF